jgi:phospho-N-acetylmuramoyl-pentapeptide-transferase
MALIPNPVMLYALGGALIIGSWLVATLLWTNWGNAYVWLIICVGLSFAAIGFADDWLSLTKRWRKGLPGKLRLCLQTIIGVAVIYTAVQFHGGADATTLYLPIFKSAAIDLGLVLFIAFGVFVMVGSANAVNITDGLDGLVSIPAAIAAAAFAVIAYLAGRVDFTTYLHMPYVPGAGEITVVCAALVGSILGFLWYNAPPARIFMGDTGSLAIGGILGTVAILIKQELVLAIVGGLFVLETLSVMIQVASFKLTGKRVFKMAPLHHHFEKLGWPESTIVVRFWIISLMLALVGLATLKVR